MLAFIETKNVDVQFASFRRVSVGSDLSSGKLVILNFLEEFRPVDYLYSSALSELDSDFSDPFVHHPRGKRVRIVKSIKDVRLLVIRVPNTNEMGLKGFNGTEWVVRECQHVRTGSLATEKRDDSLHIVLRDHLDLTLPIRLANLCVEQSVLSISKDVPNPFN